MVRRFFVPVILAAVTLGVAPRPSFGLGADEVRPRADEHFRCMYRCQERGDSFRPPPRPRPPGWDRSRPGLRSTARRHYVRPPGGHCRPRPWYRPGGWFGHGGWYGDGWHGHDGWYGYGGWFGEHDRYDDDRHGGYDWCHRPGWHSRPDRWHRGRDRSRSDGYNAHRHHPRGRDF